MEFLVITHSRDSFVANTPESVIRQILESQRKIVQQQIETGKIVRANIITGWNRRMFIYNCDTHEELQQLLLEVPAGGKAFYNEVYPLSDFDASVEIGLKNIEMGDDIMPGGTVK